MKQNFEGADILRNINVSGYVAFYQINIFFAYIYQVFLRCFRDPIRVPRIANRVPRIRENHHRVPRIRKNRVPRIREIGPLQVHIGYLTSSLKKNCIYVFNIYKMSLPPDEIASRAGFGPRAVSLETPGLSLSRSQQAKSSDNDRQVSSYTSCNRFIRIDSREDIAPVCAIHQATLFKQTAKI